MTTPPRPDRLPWLTADRARLLLDVMAALFVVAGVAAINVAAWCAGLLAYMFLNGVQAILLGLFLGYDRRPRE